MLSMRNLNRRTRNYWRVITIFTILSMLLAGCGSKTPKVYHIGILSGLDFVADISDGFKSKMAEFGYVEGTNVVYDIQKTNFDMDAYRNILQKFVADKVDLILVFPTEASMEAKSATQGTNIPVLFTFALIEGMGIVDSVREPGGNITGVRYPGPEIALKRFEILMELVPQAKRVWVPYQRGYPIVEPQLEAIRPAASAAGITIIEAPADSKEELQSILDDRAKLDDIGMDAIMFLAEPLVVVPETFAVVGKFAYEHKVPLGGVLMNVEGYGSIYGLNVNSYQSGVDAAPLADKILKGTQAGTIPVVSSDNYLQIDVNVAKTFGIDVPEGLLLQANEIVR